MRRFSILLVLPLLVACSAMQGADWPTDGGDTFRTNWQKNERTLTTANVKGMQLLWKAKLDNQPRQMHSLLEPLVIGRVNTKNGPKELVIQAGVSGSGTSTAPSRSRKADADQACCVRAG
jgi:hypothetical protein